MLKRRCWSLISHGCQGNPDGTVDPREGNDGEANLDQARDGALDASAHLEVSEDPVALHDPALSPGDPKILPLLPPRGGAGCLNRTEEASRLGGLLFLHCAGLVSPLHSGLPEEDLSPMPKQSGDNQTVRSGRAIVKI